MYRNVEIREKRMSFYMKIWDKKMDNSVKSETLVTRNYSVFIHGGLTLYLIFDIKQIVEKYRVEIQMCILMVYLIDLDKKNNMVSSKIFKWKFMNKGLPKVYVIVIEDLCKVESTRISSLCGDRY